MRTIKQHGFVDLQVLMIVVVIVLSGAFLTFRLSTSGDNQGNTALESSDITTSEAETSAANEESVDEVDTEEESEPEEVTTTVVNSNPTSENLVSFVKGGISPLINGRTVDVSAAMSGSFTGRCTYTFTLGNTSVSESNSIANSATCETTVDYTLFPKSGTYDAAIDFESSDGSVSASIDGLSVNIVPEEFSYTKGGGNWDGTNVFVSQTSTDPHTGTCTYRFTNGNSTVETSTTITNSKTCETTVPGSNFPKSGNWLFELSFTASDALITGTGGGFEIEIN